MKTLEKIYIIGGSPCAGKSTVAEILSNKYDLYYFKVDDRLDEHTKKGAEIGYPICKKQQELTWEQIWMRDPMLQCEEEVMFYEEVSQFVVEDLEKIKHKKGIITEGAAYLPMLSKRFGVPNDRYISLTPTEEFQLYHYSKREFVPYILKDCKDKETAFQNWMKRDMLFAKEVQKQCMRENYVSIINDGKRSVEELVEIIEKHFGLNNTITTNSLVAE